MGFARHRPDNDCEPGQRKSKIKRSGIRGACEQPRAQARAGKQGSQGRESQLLQEKPGGPPGVASACS